MFFSSSSSSIDHPAERLPEAALRSAHHRVSLQHCHRQAHRHPRLRLQGKYRRHARDAGQVRLPAPARRGRPPLHLRPQGAPPTGDAVSGKNSFLSLLLKLRNVCINLFLLPPSPPIRDLAAFAELSSTNFTAEQLADLVEIVDSPYTASQGAHALVICTDWDEFKVKSGGGGFNSAKFLIFFNFLFCRN